MIIFGTMSDIRNIKYDELWFIENSMDWFIYEKKPSSFVIRGERKTYYDRTKVKVQNFHLLMQPNVHIIDELAPDKELISWMLKEKKNDLLLESKSSFELFCRDYLKYIDNEDGRERLNQLWYLDKTGKTILCVCVEKTECFWRTFLTELMLICGSNVYVSSSIKITDNRNILTNVNKLCQEFINNKSLRD